MEYLLTLGSNIRIAIKDKDDNLISKESNLAAEPFIEMVLTTYEHQKKFVGDSLVDIKKTHDHKIAFGINSAEGFVTAIQEMIEEAKVLETRLTESGLLCQS
jgi:hypothetical protein